MTDYLDRVETRLAALTGSGAHARGHRRRWFLPTRRLTAVVPVLVSALVVLVVTTALLSTRGGPDRSGGDHPPGQLQPAGPGRAPGPQSEGPPPLRGGLPTGRRCRQSGHVRGGCPGSCHLGIETLLELRPAAGAQSSYRTAADREWARRWPMEQIWRLRRTG